MIDARISSATITRLKRFTAAGLLAAMGFLGTGHFAHAAAPQGTLTGTVKTLTAGTTTPINAIKITDFGTAEITNTNDIKIKIPSTVNAKWDTSDTTATLTQPAVTGVVNTTVTYADSGRTLILDVTTSFANSEFVEVSGLSYIPFAASSAVALTWAIDGATYLAGNANTALTVIPEPQLTSSITLGGNSVVGTAGSTTLLLTPPFALAANDTIVWTMPTNINVPQGAITVASQTLAGGGVFTCTGVNATRVITCTTDGVITADVAGNIVLSGITSIFVAVTGNVADLTINSVTAGSGADIALDTTTAVTATTAGVMTSTNVVPGGTTVGTTNTATVTFTTVNSIAADGNVKITFGSGFVLTSVASTDMACSTLTGGTTATTVSGQTVILTRTTGDVEVAGAQTCTIAHVINPVTAGTTGTYTISTTNSADAIVDSDAAVTADTMFAASGTSNSEATSTPLTYDIALSAPDVASAYDAGDAITITWSTNGGTGAVAAVNLDYSTDGGVTFTSIVTGTTNDGSYIWTAPSISAQSVTIRAQATDLLTVLDTDTSDAFSIGTEAEATEDTETPVEDVDTTAGSTTLLPTGTYFRGESWSTVYYVDGTTRRPFLDAQTFFTYADNFDAVIETSDDYLANFTIGTPMLPKAGTVLVKIQSVNNVYVLGEDGELRWITSEALAVSMYGGVWADYVIDVPVTAWGHFTFGTDITSIADVAVDLTIIQTRNALNSK